VHKGGEVRHSWLLSFTVPIWGESKALRALGALVHRWVCNNMGGGATTGRVYVQEYHW
jgi:hypothetical protein